jgi:uncharacterized membrane protein
VIGTLFVLLAVVFPIIHQALGEDPITEPYVAAFTLGVLVSTAFGMGVALYATASGCSTVFLAVGAAATIAVQLLAGAFYGAVAAVPTLLRGNPKSQTETDGETAELSGRPKNGEPPHK